MLFAAHIFWPISTSAFRLSILHLYIEIFSMPLFRSFAYGIAWVVGLFYIGCMTTTLALCRPISHSWNKEISGSCGSIGMAEMIPAAFNMVLDVVIVLLPLPIVWKLQMPKQKKVGVTVIFALGLGWVTNTPLINPRLNVGVRLLLSFMVWQSEQHSRYQPWYSHQNSGL